jgi:hypothetical protein
MVGILILGASLIGALACAVGLKFFLFHSYTHRIEYTPLDNKLEIVCEPEIPPKYGEINLVN